MDQGYFTVEGCEVEKSKGKRRRGAAGKSNVAVMAKSEQLEDLESGKKSSQCRYFKAKVLDHHKAEGINQTVKESFDEKSIVLSDDNTSYVDVVDYVKLHISEKSSQ
jgi:hypothetical protein